MGKVELDDFDKIIGKKDLHGTVITRERAFSLRSEFNHSARELDHLGVWNVPKKIKRGETVQIWESNGGIK